MKTRSIGLAIGSAAALIALAAYGQHSGSEKAIPGYTYGKASVPKAPISLAELDLIKKTSLWTDEDAKYLKMSRQVLEPNVKELVGVWYGFVGSNPHLLASFTDPATGKPDSSYLEAVRARFERWVLDTAEAKFDQPWLDYQFEIARRHHRSGKNKTDNAKGSANIAYRYIPTLMIPITTTIKPFLARGGHSTDEVEKMHAAWVKSVTIQATLWAYPYVREGDY